MKLRTLITVGIALALGAALAGARDFTFRTVQGGFGPYNELSWASMNNGGTVVFVAGDWPHDMTIYINDGIETTVLVSEETSPYVDLLDAVINDDGLVAFRARIPGRGWGIFATTDGTDFATLLDPNHPIGPITGLSLNNEGEVAFWGRIGDDYHAIFKTDGATVTTIADDAGELRLSIYERRTSINDSGTVAFWARFDQGGDGIFRGDGWTLDTIAASGDEFRHFEYAPAIHSSGEVYFHACLTAGGTGIYRTDGDAIIPVVESGAEFSAVWFPGSCVNEDGAILYRGDTPFWRFYTGPAPGRRIVFRERQRFYGAELHWVEPFALNDDGQVLALLDLLGDEPLTMLVAATPAPPSPEIFHVKVGADGNNDGTSWEDAFAFLQDALDFVEPTDQVWIAAGEYKPGQGLYGTSTDRQVHFLIPAGVAVYGGFAGDETSLEERAGLFDQTILSGDLNGDDEPNFANYEDNSVLVIRAGAGQGDPCVVDGLTVTAGGGGWEGGGLRLVGDAHVANCTFRANWAGDGGGVYACPGTVVSFANCAFRENLAGEYADHAGGGAFVGAAEALFTDCTFCANTSRHGGAGLWIANCGAATLAACNFGSNSPDGLSVVDCGTASVTSCTFEANSAGMCVSGTPVAISGCTFAENRYGALRVAGSPDQPVRVTNCAFVGNEGSSVYSAGANNTGTLLLRNCLFEGNVASVGAGVSNHGGSISIENCQFLQNAVDDQHGWPQARGGAVWTDGEATLRNCTFTGNTATPDGAGGAVRVIRTPPGRVRLMNCEFRRNFADRGGAIACDDAFALVAQCLFVGNGAADGAALYGERNSLPLLVNSVVAGNTAESHGGGLFAANVDDQPAVYNSILWGNEDQDGSGESSQIFGGVAEVKHSCVQGWTGELGGVGNFGEDPFFVDPVGPDGIPGTGDEDLHLSPGSPCIDRGSNWLVPLDVADLDDDGDLDEYLPLDLDGEGRFFDDPNTLDNSCGAPMVDLGPYEVGGSGPQPCVGDADGDGDVDWDDLTCLLDRYGSAHTQPGFDSVCDFDTDGVIGLRDLATLLSAYGMGCE